MRLLYKHTHKLEIEYLLDGAGIDDNAMHYLPKINSKRNNARGIFESKAKYPCGISAVELGIT